MLCQFISTYYQKLSAKGAIIGTCDIWDTDNNTDNWEPGLMTMFVTWQLIVTLDSIRNSCDVFHHKVSLAHGGSCIIRPSRAPQARGEAWEVYKE